MIISGSTSHEETLESKAMMRVRHFQEEKKERIELIDYGAKTKTIWTMGRYERNYKVVQEPFEMLEVPDEKTKTKKTNKK